MTGADPYAKYYDQWYFPATLSPKMQKERLQEMIDEKLAGYHLNKIVEDKYRSTAYAITHWYPSASQEQEKVFFETWEKAGKPLLKKEIHQIYRLKVLGTEKFWYNEELKSTSKNGQAIHCLRRTGVFDNPNFIGTYNDGEQTGFEVESVTEEFTLDWDKDWTPELESQLLPKTSFVVISNTGRKYSGFDYDDFKNRSFQELETLGKYGTLSKTMIEEIKKAQKQK